MRQLRVRCIHKHTSSLPLRALNAAHRFYKGGIFTPNTPGPCNHAMVLDGYYYSGNLADSYW